MPIIYSALTLFVKHSSTLATLPRTRRLPDPLLLSRLLMLPGHASRASYCPTALSDRRAATHSSRYHCTTPRRAPRPPRATRSSAGRPVPLTFCALRSPVRHLAGCCALHLCTRHHRLPATLSAAPSSPPQTACSSPRSTAETAAPCSRAKPCTDRAARFCQRLLVQRRPRVVRSPPAASVVAARPLCSDDDPPSLPAPCSCRVIRTLLSVPFAKSNPAASPRAPSRCRSPQPRDPGTQRARTTPRGNTRSQPAGRGCEPRAPAEPLALSLSLH
jgi:hypothetical protein